MFPFTCSSQDMNPSAQERNKSTLTIMGSQKEYWCLLQGIYIHLCIYICVFSKGCFKITPARENISLGLISSPAPIHTSHYHRFITNPDLNKIYQKKTLGYWTELSATSQKPRTQESGFLPQYCPSHMTLGSYPAS